MHFRHSVIDVLFKNGCCSILMPIMIYVSTLFVYCPYKGDIFFLTKNNACPQCCRWKEWLPMIGVGAAYTDLHPSLLALAPALQNQVGRSHVFFPFFVSSGKSDMFLLVVKSVLVFFVLISTQKNKREKIRGILCQWPGRVRKLCLVVFINTYTIGV